MKRPTDKQRLDWLWKNAPWSDCYRECNTAQVVDHQGRLYTGRTLRQAIDAAMKSASGGRKDD